MSNYKNYSQTKSELIWRQSYKKSLIPNNMSKKMLLTPKSKHTYRRTQIQGQLALERFKEPLIKQLIMTTIPYSTNSNLMNSTTTKIT